MVTVGQAEGESPIADREFKSSAGDPYLKVFLEALLKATRKILALQEIAVCKDTVAATMHDLP